MQIFDKIYKRILTLSGPAVIRYINGLFDKDYPLDSRISYHWTENIKDGLEKTIADSILSINGADTYHTEAEIRPDGSIIVRVFEYGLQEAIKHKRWEGGKTVLDFPHQKIIFLEHKKRAPESISMVINYPDGTSHGYTVPVMNFLSYSIEELDARGMAILLPLCLLKLRRAVVGAKNAGKVRELAGRLKELLNGGILAAIDKNEKAGNITGEDAHVLTTLVNELYKYLYGGYKEFKEEGVAGVLEEKLVFDWERERERIQRDWMEKYTAVEKEKLKVEKDKLKAEKEKRQMEQKAEKEKRQMEQKAEKEKQQMEQKAEKEKQQMEQKAEKEKRQMEQNMLQMQATFINIMVGNGMSIEDICNSTGMAKEAVEGILAKK